MGPTIIDYVTTDMSVAREEIFGPVISIIRAKDLDEAISLAKQDPRFEEGIWRVEVRPVMNVEGIN